MKISARKLIQLVVILFLVNSVAFSQQIADPEFKSRVEKPAFTKKHPQVLFDEAHNNFHKTEGNYRPFVELIKSDGYEVTANKESFQEKNFKGYDILIIVNALGSDSQDETAASRPAFTKQECDEVYNWVKGGGALLFIADHAPMGGAAEILANRFGVDMSKGYTIDEKEHEPDSKSWLIYSRDNGLLLNHPITSGRDSNEKINRIVAFTGQSLKGPDNSQVFLKLPASAEDATARDLKNRVSATGRSQGITFQVGKGRVVVLGEAAMLTAQIIGPEKRSFGMNKPGNDGRQLALNIMHWLAGILP